MTSPLPSPQVEREIKFLSFCVSTREEEFVI